MGDLSRFVRRRADRRRSACILAACREDAPGAGSSLAIALLAILGVWLGHTLEYIRVWGGAGLDRELTGSVHLYMVPVGLGLALLVAGAGVAVARLHRILTRRAEQARPCSPAPGPPPRVTCAQRPSPRRRLVAGAASLVLGAAVALLQMALYVVQENVESVAERWPRSRPGRHHGVHWAAPLIHVAVGFTLAAVSVVLWSLLRRREAVVRALRAGGPRGARRGQRAPLAAHGRALLPSSPPWRPRVPRGVDLVPAASAALID